MQSVPRQHCACLLQHVPRQATTLCVQLGRDAASCCRTWAWSALKGSHQPLVGWRQSAHLHGTKHWGCLYLPYAPWYQLYCLHFSFLNQRGQVCDSILPGPSMTDVELIAVLLFSTDFKWNLHMVSTLAKQMAGIYDN